MSQALIRLNEYSELALDASQIIGRAHAPPWHASPQAQTGSAIRGLEPRRQRREEWQSASRSPRSGMQPHERARKIGSGAVMIGVIAVYTLCGCCGGAIWAPEGHSCGPDTEMVIRHSVMQQEHKVQAIPSTRTSSSNLIDVVHLIFDPHGVCACKGCLGSSLSAAGGKFQPLHASYLLKWATESVHSIKPSERHTLTMLMTYETHTGVPPLIVSRYRPCSLLWRCHPRASIQTSFFPLPC